MENKSVIAFIAGAAIGAGLALLLAPEKGSDLRERLGDLGNDVLDKLKSKMDKVKEEASHFEESLEDVGL